MKRIILLLILCFSLDFANAAEVQVDGVVEESAAESVLPELIRTMSEESWRAWERMRDFSDRNIEDKELRINFMRAKKCFYFLETYEGKRALLAFEAYVTNSDVPGSEWMIRMKKRIEIVLNPELALDVAIRFFAATFGDPDTFLALALLGRQYDQFLGCFYDHGCSERKSGFLEFSLWHAALLGALACPLQDEKAKADVRRCLEFLCETSCYCRVCDFFGTKSIRRCLRTTEELFRWCGTLDGAGKTAFFMLRLSRIKQSKYWICFLRNSKKHIGEAYFCLYFAKCEDGFDGTVFSAERLQNYREVVAENKEAAAPAAPASAAPLSRRDRKRQRERAAAIRRRDERDRVNAEMRTMSSEDTWLQEIKKREREESQWQRSSVSDADAAAAVPEPSSKREPLKRTYCGCGCGVELRKAQKATCLHVSCNKCGYDRLMLKSHWSAGWIHSSVDGTNGFICGNGDCQGVLQQIG